MTLPARKVASALKRIGFERDPKGHHVVFTYVPKGGTPSDISTYMGHGNDPKDLDDHLIKSMA